jgi:hypothetical protein
MEERIKQLESDVADMKRKRRDAWDILQIIGTLLLPAAIAFAGYSYSLSMKNAEIAAAERRAQADEEVARINSHVGQADVLLRFLGELFHTDAKRRDIAVKGILLALPDDAGETILASILQTSPAPADQAAPTQQVVRTTLDQRRLSLVETLFARSSGDRKSAYERLTSRGAPWHTDPALIDDLIAAARNHMDDPVGLRNVIVTFRDVSRFIAQPRQSDIFELADEILKANPNVEPNIDLKPQIEDMKKWILTRRG